MKKFIKKILVFFLIVAVIDFGFGKACDYMTTHAKGGANKQLVDLCKKDRYDMLVMGSSKAHHNYIPQIFIDSLGLNCYNAGYDGNGIILAYGILSMIDDDRLPKIIVYDVKQQFDIYHYSGDGDYTRYFQKMKKFYGEPIVDEIVSSISPMDQIKLHSGLYRHNGDLLFVVSNYFRSSLPDKNNGYVPLSGYLSDEAPQQKDYSDQLDTLKLNYFRKFIELIKEKGIDLIVVFSPEYNTQFAKDFQPIIDLCSEEGVRIIDLFEDSTYQKKFLFKDHCHLNEAGSKMFSNKIIPEIKMLYWCPNKNP